MASRDAKEPTGRNIVILMDGTGNELGRNLSNVLKLYRICRKTDEQLCYYHPGVGTVSRVSWFNRLTHNTEARAGLAHGYGLDREVVPAYRSLL